MSKPFKVVLRGLPKNNIFKVLLKNDTIRFKVVVTNIVVSIDEYLQALGKFYQQGKEDYKNGKN